MHTLLLECTFHFHLALACWLQLPIPLSLSLCSFPSLLCSSPVRVVPLSLFAFSARKSHITLTHSQTHPHTHSYKGSSSFHCHALHFAADSCPCTKNSISTAIPTCYTLCSGHNGIVIQLTAAVTTALPSAAKTDWHSRSERDRDTETERNCRVTKREREKDREGRGTGLHSFTITTIGRCEPMRDKLLAATAAVV